MSKLSFVALMASVLALTASTVEAKEHHKHHKHHEHHATANDYVTGGGNRVAILGTPVPPGVEVLDVHNPLTEEERQDVMNYIGKPLHEGYAMGCGSCNTCCVPMECPCVPVCCPDTHGLFDGGLNKPGCCNNIQIWG